MFHKHCVKSVQIRTYFWSVFSCIRAEYGDLQISVFSPNTGKNGPEISPYLDTFQAVRNILQRPNRSYCNGAVLVHSIYNFLGW